MGPPAPNRTLLRINLLDPSTICRQCTAQLRPVLRAPSHAPLLARRAVSTTPSSRLSASYFLPNNALERAAASAVKARTQSQSSRTSATVTNDSSSTTAATAKGSASTSRLDATQPPVNAELPHRRRQAARRAAAAAEAEADSGSSSSSSAVLPAQDASSALTTVAASQPARSLRRILSACLSLSKPRLTVLVVLTAMVPYALFPVPSFLSPAVTELPSLSPLTLLFLTTGTTLCSASANALNMLYEPATDAKMSRTRNRPLVRNIIAPRVALLFALVGAAGGIGALYFGVNPTVAFLGAANIVLYAGVYTPLKRVTALNTWIGAVVGGIPPLMGWGRRRRRVGHARRRLLAPAPLSHRAAASLGGWLLAGLLRRLAVPPLSWPSPGPIRDEYRAAGLRMLAWTNPARNARVALRYSLAFAPLCFALCAAGVTEWSFALTSLPANAWLTWQAFRFWRAAGHAGTARGLFWASVWHLPVVLGLATLQKKGMWSRVWASLFGAPHDDDDDEEWDELDETPAPLLPPRKA
ncbi:protoheme IX farnesyltransferase [Verticillium dahliae VdLs.17]|uniref:Protoheme IX farnesyltransferase, mitochondrial n=1 Tax=Verticillium dahliae (strain VdLs.17 / ATCC MYA-4575 / FGSC 10137) TaxID=498257 RepID=G2X9B4_VERDV|nr:protoheme IX farnesyltransferase [Verticillium dahliae VdLs.17]EGY15582.1 protoheme IX farnesyltransferase [Verticillium dahliae VdLs.17]